ncbi:MAG: hypothetical protein AAFU55_11935, partial [Pseudomonadota bacterium]
EGLARERRGVGWADRLARAKGDPLLRLLMGDDGGRHPPNGRGLGDSAGRGDMKITRMTVFRVDLPLAEPYWLSGGRLRFDRLDSTFVRIDTDEGVSGWGEG